MSSKPETRFYQSIHKLLPKELHSEKMHNPFRGGTPDVWYSGTLDDLWVEYKWIATVPVRAPIKMTSLLSPLQQQWVARRYAEGRNVVVVLGCPKGAYVFEGLSWQKDLLPNVAWLTKRETADYIRRRTMIE